MNTDMKTPCAVLAGSARRQGFTLVELMVAMVLGLIVLGGVIQVFLGGRQAYGEIQRFTSLQETTGFLSAFLADELRGAQSVVDDGSALVITPPGPFGCSKIEVVGGQVKCDGQPVAGDGNRMIFTDWQRDVQPTWVDLTFQFSAVEGGVNREHSLQLRFALRNSIL